MKCKNILSILSILSKYDETGEWIYWAGRYWGQFDYKRGLRKLFEIDKTGEWICLAGIDWPEFDYGKGYKKLLEVDERKWIFVAEKFWKFIK